jgi:hypothetical protein
MAISTPMLPSNDISIPTQRARTRPKLPKKLRARCVGIEISLEGSIGVEIAIYVAQGVGVGVDQERSRSLVGVALDQQ